MIILFKNGFTYTTTYNTYYIVRTDMHSHQGYQGKVQPCISMQYIRDGYISVQKYECVLESVSTFNAVGLAFTDNMRW